MTLPDHVLVGVARAGTTSLYHYLAQHPEVVVSPIKEINFLAYPGAEVARRDLPRMRFPVTDLPTYEHQFEREPGQVAVDFSASCFHSPVAIGRIRQYVPRAGLIVVLRDPVARTWSAHLNRVRKGYESRSTDVALVAGEPAVDNSLYAARIDELQRAFGAERVRVLLFEDLHREDGAGLRSLLVHLGVDSDVDIDTTTTYNRASVPKGGLVAQLLPSYRTRVALQERVPRPVQRIARRAWSKTQATAPQLDPTTDARLRALFADDVTRVGELIGRDLRAWLPR